MRCNDQAGDTEGFKKANLSAQAASSVQRHHNYRHVREFRVADLPASAWALVCAPCERFAPLMCVILSSICHARLIKPASLAHVASGIQNQLMGTISLTPPVEL